MKMRIGAIVFALLASAAVSAHASAVTADWTQYQTTSIVSGLSGTVTYPGTSSGTSGTTFFSGGFSDSGSDVTASTTTGYGIGKGTQTFSGDPNWLSLTCCNPDQNITFAFTQPVDYVGFFWGSPDNANWVYLYDGSTLLGSYQGDTSTAAYPIMYPGYVDFFAGTGEEITSIELANFGSFNFETDNLSYQEAPASSPPASTIPEPSSFLLLGSGLAGLAGMLRRKAVLHG
jgi:hypothetical protein